MSKTSFVTPKGRIEWATINGTGKTDLNGRQTYTVDIVVPEDEAQDAIDKLEALWDEHKPKGAKAAKSMGYKIDEDGSVRFTLKTGTTYQSGDPKQIKVYNAKAEQVQLSDRIANGSTGRASGIAAIYDAGHAARGVTLYLDAVQVINLVRYTGGAAAFEAEEGNFEGTDATDGFSAVDL